MIIDKKKGQTETKMAAGSRHFDHWQQRQPMSDRHSAAFSS
jgi:hypothetical protein